MRILSLKFPRLEIDFWKGVIMMILDGPIFPYWDEFPEEDPLTPVSADHAVDGNGGDVPGGDGGILLQKLAESQEEVCQGETVLR